jgi:hypothetical protein
MVRYDEDRNLGSLLPDDGRGKRPASTDETWPDTYRGAGDPIATGNGSTSSIEQPSGV